MSDNKQAGTKPSTESTVTLTEVQLAKMLADASASAVQQMRSELLAGIAQGAGASAGGDSGLMERLALAIAEISDQGTNRKRVAPEILAARAKAHERAVALVLEARKNGEQPEYRLVSKVYLNEQLIEPFQPGPDRRPIPTVIVWTGMPNEAMRPLNEVAIAIYKEFKASIGSSERVNGDTRPFSMTPGGLVVKTSNVAHRREVGPLPPDPFDQDLTVKTAHDPTAPFVHVLGTIAPPAKQNAFGESHNIAAA